MQVSSCCSPNASHPNQNQIKFNKRDAYKNNFVKSPRRKDPDGRREGEGLFLGSSFPEIFLLFLAPIIHFFFIFFTIINFHFKWLTRVQLISIWDFVLFFICFLFDMPRHRRTNQPVDFEDEDDCSRHGEKPGQRNAANARERARMRILSKAFSRLKTTLPWVPPDTKLSKLDTLRLATSYIAHLRTILTDDGSPPPVVHPLNLTWPFTIQQQSADHPSRSPDEWSSEEHQTGNRTSVHVGLMPGCVGNSTSCSEPDLDDSPRHLSPRNHHFIDHRHHYSDSLLNIG